VKDESNWTHMARIHFASFKRLVDAILKSLRPERHRLPHLKLDVLIGGKKSNQADAA